MQVQGFAAALAMLDDHESSGPPDGVESVYEGARYRKNKLGASGHATKDEKDEEQHKQRERESHKRVARHGRRPRASCQRGACKHIGRAAILPCRHWQ